MNTNDAADLVYAPWQFQPSAAGVHASHRVKRVVTLSKVVEVYGEMTDSEAIEQAQAEARLRDWDFVGCDRVEG